MLPLPPPLPPPDLLYPVMSSLNRLESIFFFSLLVSVSVHDDDGGGLSDGEDDCTRIEERSEKDGGVDEDEEEEDLEDETPLLLGERNPFLVLALVLLLMVKLPVSMTADEKRPGGGGEPSRIGDMFSLC